MTQYRQHQTNTILEVQQDYQTLCRNQYDQYADMIIALIGVDKYAEWITAFLIDTGPWSECLKLIKAFYNVSVDANECQSQMKDERPV